MPRNGNGNHLKARLVAAYERGVWDLGGVFTRREINALLRQVAVNHSRLSATNHARVRGKAQRERAREQRDTSAELKLGVTAIRARLATTRDQREEARIRREERRQIVRGAVRRSQELRARIEAQREARRRKLDPSEDFS